MKDEEKRRSHRSPAGQPAASPPVPLGANETLDPLTRRLQIIQRRHGHRAATDDILLAWAAARACREAALDQVRVLELGSGKGTVAMLLLACRPEARVTGLEVLPQSHELAVRNAALNGLGDRFRPQLGDLRDPRLLSDRPPYQLVLGAPPFMPLGSGVLPRDAQRAAGRFELRGGVGEYAETAAAHLASGGHVILLMDGAVRSRTRAELALTRVDLHPRRLLAVRHCPGSAPVYWIIEAQHQSGTALEEDLPLRTAPDGPFSAEYQAVRDELDLP